MARKSALKASSKPSPSTTGSSRPSSLNLTPLSRSPSGSSVSVSVSSATITDSADIADSHKRSHRHALLDSTTHTSAAVMPRKTPISTNELLEDSTRRSSGRARKLTTKAQALSGTMYYNPEARRPSDDSQTSASPELEIDESEHEDATTSPVQAISNASPSANTVAKSSRKAKVAASVSSLEDTDEALDNARDDRPDETVKRELRRERKPSARAREANPYIPKRRSMVSPNSAETAKQSGQVIEEAVDQSIENLGSPTSPPIGNHISAVSPKRSSPPPEASPRSKIVKLTLKPPKVPSKLRFSISSTDDTKSATELTDGQKATISDTPDSSPASKKPLVSKRRNSGPNVETPLTTRRKRSSRHEETDVNSSDPALKKSHPESVQESTENVEMAAVTKPTSRTQERPKPRIKVSEPPTQEELLAKSRPSAIVADEADSIDELGGERPEPVSATQIATPNEGRKDDSKSSASPRRPRKQKPTPARKHQARAPPKATSDMTKSRRRAPSPSSSEEDRNWIRQILRESFSKHRDTTRKNRAVGESQQDKNQSNEASSGNESAWKRGKTEPQERNQAKDHTHRTASAKPRSMEDATASDRERSEKSRWAQKFQPDPPQRGFYPPPPPPPCELFCLDPASRILAFAQIAAESSDSDTDEEDDNAPGSSPEQYEKWLAIGRERFCVCKQTTHAHGPMRATPLNEGAWGGHEQSDVIQNEDVAEVVPENTKLPLKVPPVNSIMPASKGRQVSAFYTIISDCRTPRFNRMAQTVPPSPATTATAPAVGGGLPAMNHSAPATPSGSNTAPVHGHPGQMLPPRGSFEDKMRADYQVLSMLREEAKSQNLNVAINMDQDQIRTMLNEHYARNGPPRVPAGQGRRKSTTPSDQQREEKTPERAGEPIEFAAPPARTGRGPVPDDGDDRLLDIIGISYRATLEKNKGSPVTVDKASQGHRDEITMDGDNSMMYSTIASVADGKRRVDDEQALGGQRKRRKMSRSSSMLPPANSEVFVID